MLKHLVLLASAGALIAGSPAFAQSAADYPNRPVKIIVTVPAGGGVDTVTRLIAEQLRQKFGQPFVIENRGGASGNIGAEAVFKSDPDGYTLMASQPAPITVNKSLYKKLNFDPDAIEPVAIMSRIPNVLLVKNDFPAKTAREFVDHVKSNPGKLSYASQGTGTTSHLTTELLMTLTGTKMVHVPYKGTGPALNDIIAGHVDVIFMELAAAYKLHTGGRARILAVATDRRLEIMPDIPTLAEIGVPGCESDTWNAISAPPRTPPAVVDKLNRAINDVLASAEIRSRFRALQLLPGGGSPAQMGAFVKQETRRWGEVIRRAGLKPQE